MTAELVASLTEDEAERLTTRIGLKLGVLADSYESVMPLIREAIDRKAHEALGYPSVGAYAADRFGDSLTRLGDEMRRVVGRELAAAGMSIRAIAPIVGVSRETVRRDLQSGDTNVSPDEEPPKIVGLDGKAYIRQTPADPVAQAVTNYPELAHFRDTDQPKKAVEVARALDGYGEAERKMRRDNLAKFIAAEQRNGEPFKEPEPDPNYLAVVAMFDAATSALIQINRIDGPAIVAAAAIHVESFEADNWRGQFQQAADTYQQLAQACGQRLRVIR